MITGWRSVWVIGFLFAQPAVAELAQPTPGNVPGPVVLQRGEQIYTRCVACHAIERNRTGPQHCGLFGRRAGTAPGYAGYSNAMRDSKIVWNERSLDVFLQGPMQAVPGTYMGYAGVKDAQERADLIAWLYLASKPGQSCRVSD